MSEMIQDARRYFLKGLELHIVRHFYHGLWEVRYKDGGQVWAGPFKTKKEAIEKLRDALEGLGS